MLTAVPLYDTIDTVETEERNAEIVRLRESGQTLQQIAVRFGISRERVRQILAHHPVSLTKVCPICNTPFTTNKMSTVYCSKRCRMKNMERKRRERMLSDPQYREKRNEYYKRYRMKYPDKHRQYLKQRYRRIKANPQKYEEYKRKCSQYKIAWYHRMKQDPKRYRRYREKQRLYSIRYRKRLRARRAAESAAAALASAAEPSALQQCELQAPLDASPHSRPGSANE